MKKLLLILICTNFLESFCIDNTQNKVKIVEYEESHNKVILEIAYQDPILFFPGLSNIKKTQPNALEETLEAGKTEMENSLAEPLKLKKVLIDCNSGEVIAFSVYFKAKEQSIESMRPVFESQGIPFDENMISTIYPHIKKTNSECTEFAKIESLAVSSNKRGMGYGKMLLAETINDITQNWPHISRIDLDVDLDNAVAMKLYESAGFTKSITQPLEFMEVAQYTKELK